MDIILLPTCRAEANASMVITRQTLIDEEITKVAPSCTDLSLSFSNTYLINKNTKHEQTMLSDH